jgi:hypothetical protein
VGHHRPDSSLAPVVRGHGDNAAEDLDRPAVPIFGHVVKGGETRIDEGPQIFADDFASIPFRNTKTARGILHKAVNTLTKGFVVDFLPKGQQPFRRCRLGEAPQSMVKTRGTKMASITYILQFRGKGTPGPDPTKLKVKSVATSLNVSTTITHTGVASTLELCPGDNALFESDVTFLGTTSFQESGTIRFPGGHALNFSTVGQGIIGASANSGTQSGSVIWKIESGEGEFAEASGFIASTFTVDAEGNVIDNQLGVIFTGEE